MFSVLNKLCSYRETNKDYNAKISPLIKIMMQLIINNKSYHANNHH